MFKNSLNQSDIAEQLRQSGADRRLGMRLQAFKQAFSKAVVTSLSNPAAVLVLSFFLNPALLLDGDARSSLYSGLLRFRMQISHSVNEEAAVAS